MRLCSVWHVVHRTPVQVALYEGESGLCWCTHIFHFNQNLSVDCQVTVMDLVLSPMCYFPIQLYISSISVFVNQLPFFNQCYSSTIIAFFQLYISSISVFVNQSPFFNQCYSSTIIAFFNQCISSISVKLCCAVLLFVP